MRILRIMASKHSLREMGLRIRKGREALKFWIMAIMGDKSSVTKLGANLALRSIGRPFPRRRWRENELKNTRIKGSILIRGRSSTWRRRGRLRSSLSRW